VREKVDGEHENKKKNYIFFFVYFLFLQRPN